MYPRDNKLKGSLNEDGQGGLHKWRMKDGMTSVLRA